MKLYVPEIGDRLRLTADWTFNLYREHRNTSLRTHFGLNHETDVDEVTLPSGTILKVDRIYIRKGVEDYSSISFYAEGIGTGSGAFGRPKSARFWAKLVDCNRIEFEIETLQSEKPKVKKVIISGSWKLSTKDERISGVYFEDDRDLTTPLFLIKNIEEKVTYSNGFFSRRSTYYTRTVGYELQTVEGEPIKTYKSYSSLQSYLRNWAKKQ